MDAAGGAMMETLPQIALGVFVLAGLMFIGFAMLVELLGLFRGTWLLTQLGRATSTSGWVQTHPSLLGSGGARTWRSSPRRSREETTR